MPFREWSDFKRGFNQYIRRTFGIFTLIDPANLIYFDLDKFMDSIYGRDGALSISKVEMLMALSTFIDIKEAENAFTFNIIPHKTIIMLKNLIDKGLLQIHPFSTIKKECANYMTPKKHSVSAAAA